MKGSGMVGCLVSAALLILCSVSVSAQAARGMAAEQVLSVTEDQTIRLASGQQARFVDIVFPDAALAAPWFATHLLQHEVTFRAVAEDRYGRTLISAPAMQEAMLRAGVAVLFPQGRVPASLQKAEREARQAKRGVWGKAGFVLTPENAAQHFLEFHVVEGAITRTHESRSATYLNFGEHWQTDFSATVTGRARRGFKTLLAEIKPGSVVQVRGTIYAENGPMIRLTRPEQLAVVK